MVTTRVRVEATRRLAIELGDLSGADGDELPELGDDLVIASYHLVSLAPVGPADRLRLLSADTPAERLELLDSALDDVEAVLRFRAG